MSRWLARAGSRSPHTSLVFARSTVLLRLVSRGSTSHPALCVISLSIFLLLRRVSKVLQPGGGGGSGSGILDTVASVLNGSNPRSLASSPGSPMTHHYTHMQDMSSPSLSLSLSNHALEMRSISIDRTGMHDHHVLSPSRLRAWVGAGGMARGRPRQWRRTRGWASARPRSRGRSRRSRADTRATRTRYGQISYRCRFLRSGRRRRAM